MATSVHALVRLLKSSNDPPSTPGPSKIEIASLAWSDPSFRGANKGEVIGEWILTFFGQAKKTRWEEDTSPIADSRCWTLLCAVLTTPPPTGVRPTKTWLLPLLNRFQIDTIVIELLTLQSLQVLAPARGVLAVLWPLAEKKINVDALVGCLGAVFNACTKLERLDDDLGWICTAVVATYRNALVNAGNKKKLYNSFLNSHLSSWLCAVCPSSTLVGLSSAQRLQDNIYAAGSETLFSLDALKQPLDTLFDVLSSCTSSYHSVLPKLCISFLHATHKHRSALFASATGTTAVKEEVRKKGMEFIGRCWNLIRSSSTLPEDLVAQRCKSVVGILRIVEKERLFVAHATYGAHPDVTKGEHEGELVLSEARDKAVELLEAVNASPQDRAEQVVLSIQLLDVLVQIEYDFIGSVLERILSALINIPPSISQIITTTSSEFLDRVLEYHAKTRTVHTYALALLRSTVANSLSPTSETFTSRSAITTFPLAFHLPALARALRSTLNPTQSLPLAAPVLQAVESAWTGFKDANEQEPSTKKRKVTEGVTDCDRDASSVLLQARGFSCMARVSGTILSNLPAHAYSRNEPYSLDHIWGDVGKLGWATIWECLRERSIKSRDTAKSANSKKRKHVVETAPLLYPHIVASATLRFLYDVRARVSVPLGDCDSLGEAQVGTLLDVARDEASDPELVLEIIRALLWHAWYTQNCETKKQIEIQPIFAMILDILSTCPLSKSNWSGVSAAITRNTLGLAVLHVLTTRWIDVFHALASTDNLERFISLLLVASPDLCDGDNPDESHVGITQRNILLSLLRNAQFWELHNIRAVFLSSITSLTAPLSPYCFSNVEVGSSTPLTAIAHDELTLACNIYGLLRYVPPEYFTRSVRTELVRRAMAGDVQICIKLEGQTGQRSESKKKRDKVDGGHRGKTRADEADDRVPAEELKKWSRRLMFVRAFSQRMAQFLGAPSHSVSLAFVKHLLCPPSILSPPSALTSATLDLIQLHTLNLLRSQEPGAAISISAVISTLMAAKPFSQSNSQRTWAQLVVQSSVLKLMECVAGDFDPARVPDQVKLALETLLEALESALSQGVAENDAQDLDWFPSCEEVDAWSRMLSLKRWLGISPQAAAPFGRKLAAIACRENSTGLDSKTCSSILGLLFEELWCMPDDMHRIHLDVLVCFYAINGGSDIEHTMDGHVTQASKRMSVEDFSRLLDILEEGIGGSELRVGHREGLIRLGQIVLHDAPQGTLKVVQRFATRCFNMFADQEEIYASPSCLKLQCLEFIARHCSDRPAAIRSVDLGSIWSLLNKVLSGSSQHDDTTIFPIFHHIITIIGVLIRLRRDLVVHTLPHLGLVLRQLMMLTRKIRPQLGAKQHKIVTDTFPPWLSASQPLRTDEARALARLLTSLTAKTVPRTHAAPSTEPQKAASLAKPFAKHASYVLVAYVDAFNDPLCVVDAETRRELEPGLFALCEMVGEHSRDALMVSALDSGGKIILKSLWKEYEKQRYVGKG